MDRKKRLEFVAVGLPILIAIAVAAAVALQGDTLILALADAEDDLMQQVSVYPVRTALIYIGVGALLKMLPIPAGFSAMVAAGYLFGGTVGGVLAMISATTSAVVVFALARPLFADLVGNPLSDRLAAFEPTLKANSFRTIVAIRLIPIVPAWLVNLLPLAFPVPFRTVALGTSVGIAPIAFVAAHTGAGLKQLTELRDSTAVLRHVMDPAFIVPISLLALLLVSPLFVRAWKTLKSPETKRDSR